MDETNTEPKKGNSMMLIGIIVVLIIVGLAVMMMQNRNQTSQTANDTATSIAESSEVVEDTSVKTFELEAGSFYFKPIEIRVKKGDKVKVVMTSADMMHDFVIDELNVKLPVTKSGETNTVEFTADTAGEFEFYCSVGQHRANGQVGTIIVEE